MGDIHKEPLAQEIAQNSKVNSKLAKVTNFLAKKISANRLEN